MILYKYAGQHGPTVLERLQIKVSPPNEFNDPFEVTPWTKRSLPRAAVLKKATEDPEHYRPVFEDLQKKGFSRSFEEFIEHFPTAFPDDRVRFSKEAIQRFIEYDLTSIDRASEAIGILCLSSIRDSIPMWAYYSDSHRGIVLGLESSLIGSDDERFQPVHYVKRRQRIDLINHPDSNEGRKQHRQMLFKKGTAWAHEREYRKIFLLADLVVRPSEMNQPLPIHTLNIDSQAIREIIFGCWIAPETEARIRQEIARRPKTFGHIKLFRSARHKAEFALNIVPA